MPYHYNSVEMDLKSGLKPNFVWYLHKEGVRCRRCCILKQTVIWPGRGFEAQICVKKFERRSDRRNGASKRKISEPISEEAHDVWHQYPPDCLAGHAVLSDFLLLSLYHKHHILVLLQYSGNSAWLPSRVACEKEKWLSRHERRR